MAHAGCVHLVVSLESAAPDWRGPKWWSISGFSFVPCERRREGRLRCSFQGAIKCPCFGVGRGRLLFLSVS